MNLELYEFYQSTGFLRVERLNLIKSTNRDGSLSKFFRDNVTGTILQKEKIFDDNNFLADDYVDAANESFGHRVREQDIIDTARRRKMFLDQCKGQKIVDYGCGYSNFLISIKNDCDEVAGVELSTTQRAFLKAKGINSYSDLSLIPFVPDKIFLFHSFHYLLYPVTFLRHIQKISQNNRRLRVFIEIPMASDLLLQLESFRNFSFHKELLILHSIDSFLFLVKACGVKSVSINKIQRYNFFNHMKWFLEGVGGGHMASKNCSHDILGIYNRYLVESQFNDTCIFELKYDK